MAAAAAAFLANMSEARQWFREQVISVGALAAVLALLDARDSFPPHQSRLSECVLGALAQLCSNSEPAAELLQGLPGANISALVALLSKLLKDKNPLVRLNAAACIGNMYRLPPFQQSLRSAVSEQVLPVLVRFLSDYPTEDEELRRAVELAPRVLAAIVRDDDVLQRIAKEGDTVEKLAHILLSEPDGGAEAKVSVADSKQAPTLASVAAKSKGDVDSEVTAPLLTILSSSDPPGVAHSLEVLVAASAAISNLVLEFSPLKQAVIAGGGVELLVALTERVDDDARELRLNSLCAIKNLLHQASLELMQEVIRVLSWTRLMSLVDESDRQVQDEALGILRNLSCVKEADADFVLDGVGAAALLATVKRKLAVRHGCGHSTTDDTAMHALFVVSNLACGGPPLRRLLCADEGLVELIKDNLTSSHSDLQHAALWCIINLTEPEGAVAGANATRADDVDAVDAGAAAVPPPASGGRGSADYVESLRAHGVVAVLETLAQAGGSAMDATVRERAKSALAHFEVAHGGLASAGASPAFASEAVTARAAIAAMYGAGSAPDAQRAAHQWLQAFQASPAAWRVARELLTDEVRVAMFDARLPPLVPEVRFFGALTIQIKVSRDWDARAGEAATEAEALRDELLARLAESAGGPAFVTIKICTA
ncbi:Armadillo repeat-containing protein 8, partial [Cladochytrium tenue]